MICYKIIKFKFSENRQYWYGYPQNSCCMLIYLLLNKELRLKFNFSPLNLLTGEQKLSIWKSLQVNYFIFGFFCFTPLIAAVAGVSTVILGSSFSEKIEIYLSVLSNSEMLLSLKRLHMLAESSLSWEVCDF